MGSSSAHAVCHGQWHSRRAPLATVTAHAGTLLRGEVNGRLLMKAFLSGMPTCRLGLNIHGQDCTFNSIVSQRDWDMAQCITFVPPDNGNKTEFEVMRYRLCDNIRPPFQVISNVIERGRTRVLVRPCNVLCPSFR
jgi:AP-2 complex subunit mu-1